jgi:Rps23 Pro-64 3,4-dihydroxylase Tpa1-like proline 4-hydroxylase
MIEYEAESLGVFSLSLYRRRTCREIIDSISAEECWGPAYVRTSQDNGEYQTELASETRAASILWSDRAHEIYKGFHTKLDGLVKPLVNELWGTDFREFDATQMVRYSPGGYYRTHTDNGCDLGARFFTVLCYLNDDFEGGGTNFPSLNYVVKPECGKAVFFPSKYHHCAEPVRGGNKYVLVSWLIGPTPITWI